MKRMGFYVNCLSAEIHTDPFFHGTGQGVGFELLQYDVLFVCASMCMYVLCLSINVYLFVCLSLIWERQAWMHTCRHACHSALVLKYDVEALIMDVSSSWKGGKALIYTHRFPGIFIGLAKCHYTAGGEVMNCNKLWCGWVCVFCHWLINRNTVTSLKRYTTLPPPVIFSNTYSTHNRTCKQKSECMQVQRIQMHSHVCSHVQYAHM